MLRLEARNQRKQRKGLERANKDFISTEKVQKVLPQVYTDDESSIKLSRPKPKKCNAPVSEASRTSSSYIAFAAPPLVEGTALGESNNSGPPPILFYDIIAKLVIESPHDLGVESVKNANNHEVSPECKETFIPVAIPVEVVQKKQRGWIPCLAIYLVSVFLASVIAVILVGVVKRSRSLPSKPLPTGGKDDSTTQSPSRTSAPTSIQLLPTRPAAPSFTSKLSDSPSYSPTGGVVHIEFAPSPAPSISGTPMSPTFWTASPTGALGHSNEISESVVAQSMRRSGKPPAIVTHYEESSKAEESGVFVSSRSLMFSDASFTTYKEIRNP